MPDIKIPFHCFYRKDVAICNSEILFEGDMFICGKTVNILVAVFLPNQLFIGIMKLVAQPDIFFVYFEINHFLSLFIHFIFVLHILSIPDKGFRSQFLKHTLYKVSHQYWLPRQEELASPSSPHRISDIL